MAFIPRQNSSRAQNTRDPLKITISQFKFSPQNPRHKIKLNLNPQSSHDHLSATQPPRRGLSFLSDRQKKLERLSKRRRVIELEETPPNIKPQMFMTWRDRSSSVKRVYVPADKLLLEMMRTVNQNTPQRSMSQKKISPLNFDLDLRKNKVQTATRIKGTTPMQLLTRKLQWRGRQIKRMPPKTIDYNTNTQKPLFKEQDSRLDKIFLANLNGWQSDNRNRNDFLPGTFI